MGRTSNIVIVTGTGTEVGKTHVARTLLAAWGEKHRVVGYKPIETGIAEDALAPAGDARELARASTFHVKQSAFRYSFADPVSPHLAARRARRTIDVERIVQQAHALAEVSDGVVIELAGGLFTPLATGLYNADLARRIKPARLVLVAPDRLGVLHDVVSALRAARVDRLDVTGVVVSAPAVADASTGTNAAEIEGLGLARVLAVFPRARAGALPSLRAARKLMQAIDITRIIRGSRTP